LIPDTTSPEPCVQCGTGEWGDDGDCRLCPPGTYANADHSQCLNVSEYGGSGSAGYRGWISVVSPSLDTASHTDLPYKLCGGAEQFQN
jgi:hypothetical protein